MKNLQKTAEALGRFVNVEAEVNRLMVDENIRMEVLVDKKWVEVKELEGNNEQNGEA